MTNKIKVFLLLPFLLCGCSSASSGNTSITKDPSVISETEYNDFISNLGKTNYTVSASAYFYNEKGEKEPDLLDEYLWKVDNQNQYFSETHNNVYSSYKINPWSKDTFDTWLYFERPVGSDSWLISSTRSVSFGFTYPEYKDMVYDAGQKKYIVSGTEKYTTPDAEYDFPFENKYSFYKGALVEYELTGQYLVKGDYPYESMTRTISKIGNTEIEFPDESTYRHLFETN